MKANLWILIFLGLWTAQPIYIPLTGRNMRCMIVYSVGDSETVKLDINLPMLTNQQGYEYYEISWKNTESNEVGSDTIKNGRYRKQLSLNQNVIYDLCIRVESSRDFGVALVEYNAHNLFSVNQAEVKVPENLLKSADITKAYLNANDIDNNIEAFRKMQENRTNTHAEIFKKTNAISIRMVQISIFELVVIVLAGGYQFWAIRSYLKSRNYA